MVGRIGRGEARLAAAHRLPHPPGDPAQEEAARSAVARPASGGTVLAVAHDVVRDRVVHRHVVHLGDRKLLAVPRLPSVAGDGDPAVAGDDLAVAVLRVDPHVVVVPHGTLQERRGRGGDAAVQSGAVGRGQEVGFVGVVGVGLATGVVRRAARQVAVVAGQLPLAAAVVGAPQLAAVGVAALPGHAVAGLDEGVDPVRVVGAHAQRDLADLAGGQAVPFQPRPRRAAVAGDVDRAAGAAGGARPGADGDLPHAGEEGAGVGRIDHQVAGAGLLVHEEHVLPGDAAVERAVDAALGLGRVAVADRRRVDDVRVGRVHDDAADPARSLQPHVGPRLAGVQRLPDAVADRHVGADERLAGPGPHDVGVRRRHGHFPDRVDRLVVEDRTPVDAAVLRLPQPARGRAGVVGERIAGDARHRRDSVPHRPDVAELHRLKGRRGDVLGGCGRRRQHWPRSSGDKDQPGSREDASTHRYLPGSESEDWTADRPTAPGRRASSSSPDVLQARPNDIVHVEGVLRHQPQAPVLQNRLGVAGLDGDVGDRCAQVRPVRRQDVEGRPSAGREVHPQVAVAGHEEGFDHGLDGGDLGWVQLYAGPDPLSQLGDRGIALRRRHRRPRPVHNDDEGRVAAGRPTAKSVLAGVFHLPDRALRVYKADFGAVEGHGLTPPAAFVAVAICTGRIVERRIHTHRQRVSGVIVES